MELDLDLWVLTVGLLQLWLVLHQHEFEQQILSPLTQRKPAPIPWLPLAEGLAPKLLTLLKGRKLW